MEFYSASDEKRPVRLCEATRQFAHESLNHKYGKETLAHYSVSFDGDAKYAEASDIDKYDMAIEKICREAPIRICDGEKLSGAATLGAGIHHAVPASVDGACTFSGVSHLTVDFGKVLKIGWNGIREEVEISLAKHDKAREKRFLESCLHCIKCLKLWHKRYLDELEKREEYKANFENLKRVPFEPAQNFFEAVQSIWFSFAFLRLCGNWPGLGRLDVMLGPYLKRDLENGTLTLDEAREILAHFFIKGCEWIAGGDCGSGDAQHYQNIVISGTDEAGRDVTNEVTYLILDIIEETGISDFPTSVRFNENTDRELLEKVARVIRHGGGVVAVYGEDTVKKAMIGYGYSSDEASRFANDGCWEVQVPGKTYFTYCPFDALRALQKFTFDDYSGRVLYDTFDELYDKFISDIKGQVDGMVEYHKYNFVPSDKDPEEWDYAEHIPCSVVSLLEEGCIEKGRSYLEGGPVYNVFSPHIGGLPDAVNALYVIKKLVFEEKKLTLAEFFEVLRNNWKDNEALRRYIMSRYVLYGNDNDEVDEIYSDITDKFAAICLEANGRTPYKYPAGVSTFGRQIQWAPERTAAPHGRCCHDVLSGNTSPTPGTDNEGATAVVRSYCKADLTKMVTGSALDIHLLPSSLAGEDGISALVSLMKGFVMLGGFFMQIDVVDAQVLKEAQKHPENYQTLSVRVSGWNARFVTLNKEWQNMIIERDTK